MWKYRPAPLIQILYKDEKDLCDFEWEFIVGAQMADALVTKTDLCFNTNSDKSDICIKIYGKEIK